MSDARPWEGRRIHLVGIGGAGMSGWARVAVQLGATVSGSDRADSPALEKLRALGIVVHVGHDAANVPAGADVFVSTAIPADNPERVARAQPRAELLRELTALKRVIAIAGAHGKTTTSSMAAHALLGAGTAPGYLIGGALRSTGENADWGAGEWLVVEADESDKSMLALSTDVAVVLNVELDHHATYASLAQLGAAFDAFRAGATQAVVVAPELARDPGDVVFAPEELVLEPGGSRFTWRGHEVHLTVPGAHNARNAAAALEACRLAGADEAALVAALATFSGAGRRFERLGETASGALVVDDYAHHPTEVAATIAAARSLQPRRLVACFQPHLFSRTQELHREFGAALAAADVAVVLDVYPARERAEDFPGVSGRLIAEAAADAADGRTVFWLPTLEDAERVLAPRLRAGDVVLVLGAGDVDRLGRALVG
ncbi:MAG TPA: Mur ligase domain-containing protein [Baekduia sp.]|uniref:UDP-N-acetylmuramate--L-alanine ligase n=1 Tax=Baekduia sp. TaxID=2600305 RepID=UPI002B577E1E|nr:Mur ligase domain-containing protein [Baekduia sp.]HMJ37390.1 Mur ligase domain-containing protein [Baekduia sp.]